MRPDQPFELFDDDVSDPAAITELVSKYGVAVLVEQVENRRGMFWAARALAREHGECATLKRDSIGEEGAVLRDLFDQPWMHAVAEAYFGADPYVFNPEITLASVLPGPDPVTQVDDQPGLKFLLYVTEVDSGSGVLRCILGSHHAGKRLPSAEPTDRLVRLEAPQGSFLVLDGDLTLRNAIVRRHPRITASARCYRA
ncbi:hypothetical protein [Allokutzneria albata]|uniref:Phytanoyl-CoA dioxygenase (PhyH) n=1 Tax=Allokutzneria albata TaxID=211114 RepID=A0A1G9TFR7_ALLAB|nr:hypothetical protein [Allokutzneria albata]SDM46344.1 hypothetical protein SAMN04489726_1750 [Allokutzneria albata]